MARRIRTSMPKRARRTLRWKDRKNGQRMQRLKTQLLLLSATDPRPL